MEVVRVLDYLGIELLDSFVEYYLPRYQQAVERGFDRSDQKFYWLYLELRERLLLLGQTRRYLLSLPMFMTSATEEQIFQSVTSYISSLFKPDKIGEIERNAEDTHPFFNDLNPYWLQMNEVFDSMGPDYDMANLPLMYVDLCEYAVRGVRLYLQIREQRFHAIDKGKFDLLAKAQGNLTSSA